MCFHHIDFRGQDVGRESGRSGVQYLGRSFGGLGSFPAGGQKEFASQVCNPSCESYDVVEQQRTLYIRLLRGGFAQFSSVIFLLFKPGLELAVH
jgi:hypothetical protein